MKPKCKVLRIYQPADPKLLATGPTLTLRHIEQFGEVDAELVEVAATNKKKLIEAAKDTDIILLANAPITRWMLEASPKCLAIVGQYVGFDYVDVTAATENNIIVVNNPSSEWCLEEVSNHAITLLLACAKKLVLLNKLVKDGRWDDAKKAQKPMGSIYGQTLGIIGCGAIARMVARKAQCFGLKVIGYDPNIEKSLIEKDRITPVDLPALLKESDYISAHPSLNQTSYHLMDEQAFKQMKQSAYFINTARGNVVDEPALIKALQEKWIAGAGLDVFEKEPVDKNNPLLKMDNVITLPHDGSYSDNAFAQAPINAAREIGRILRGKWPKNVVNKSVNPRIKLVKEA
jgi:D-3-phosphoglycerate dehydrogenase